MLRRMRWLWFAAALLAGMTGSAMVAAAQDYVSASYYGPGATVSVSYFYDALAPYGRWIDYAPYGWCWSPDDVSADWRPYSDGDWAYTDYGWTWVDDEPWGWGPFHYGRWLYDPAYGWLWVPGTDWAPAWVAWCASDDWVGWTPLPPGVGWNASLGVRFASFDYRRVPSNRWCFVERRDLADGNLRSRIVPISRNGSLLVHSQNVTQFAVRGGRPVNVGPNVTTIERMSGRRVPRLRIVDAPRPQAGRPRVSGGRLQLFRRPLSPAPANAAPRMQARRPMPQRAATPARVEQPRQDRGPARNGRGHRQDPGYRGAGRGPARPYVARSSAARPHASYAAPGRSAAARPAYAPQPRGRGGQQVQGPVARAHGRQDRQAARQGNAREDRGARGRGRGRGGDGDQ